MTNRKKQLLELIYNKLKKFKTQRLNLVKDYIINLEKENKVININNLSNKQLKEIEENVIYKNGIYELKANGDLIKLNRK